MWVAEYDPPHTKHPKTPNTAQTVSGHGGAKDLQGVCESGERQGCIWKHCEKKGIRLPQILHIGL